MAGQVIASYGQQRASGVNWQGLVVAAEQGAPVRSIAAGRVIYADWLPGLGLLAIVDHGEGYLSLYGHNEQLCKAAGESVAAGEVIAAAGDSGGRLNASCTSKSGATASPSIPPALVPAAAPGLRPASQGTAWPSSPVCSWRGRAWHRHTTTRAMWRSVPHSVSRVSYPISVYALAVSRLVS